MKHHLLPVSPANVQWGYFSKKAKPALTLKSGDRATIETLTHHANDDYERMIANDPGAESVFHWTREHKAVVRRGAGPIEGPFQRGSGEGVAVTPDTEIYKRFEDRAAVQLRRGGDRHPVAPHQVAHQRARSNPHQFLVLGFAQHRHLT